LHIDECIVFFIIRTTCELIQGKGEKMSKTLWLGMVLTTVACLVACGDDSSTNTQEPQYSEDEVSASSGNEKDPGNLDDSSDSRDDSSSSVEKSTESGDESSSSKKSTGEKISSSAKSGTESSDSDAEKIWSWDTPKEKFLNPDMVYGTFVDSKRDHKSYKVVEYYKEKTPYSIQGTWFAENLNYEMDGSWCFDNDPQKCNVAGRLYSWDAAMKACPEGWRLPSDEDWDDLFGKTNAWTDAISKGGIRLKSMTGWTIKLGVDQYIHGEGEDVLGFSAIPAGLWNDDEEVYANAGQNAYFWSSTEANSDEANVVILSSTEEKVVAGGSLKKSYGFSVRCVQDKAADE
jgi:uncharacterized protein (TIGR02145 family)